MATQAQCDLPGNPSTNAYVYAYDFGNTTASRFNLSVWYNNTNDLNTTQAAPDAQRVNQVTLLQSSAIKIVHVGIKLPVCLAAVRHQTTCY